MERDRMFRVIVVGGLSLVAPAACSSTVGPGDASDASAAIDVTSDFPSELPVFVDVPAPRDVIDAADISFPSELPVVLDAGRDDGLTDASVESGFPLECAAGQVACGGACVDITTDPSNCGQCGQACGTSEVCRSGACTPLPPLDGGAGG